jgi:RNA polymerase sigma factor (sigma-70 family)
MNLGMKKKFKDEIQLFDAIVNEDKQAIRQFHDAIIEPLYGYVRKQVNNQEAAQDIATDAFVEILKRAAEFDDLKHLKGFIFSNAYFKCLDYHKKAIPAIRPLDDFENTLTSNQNIEDEITMAEFKKAVYMQVNNLAREIDRQILLLSLTGLKTSEIALQLGCTEEYVRNRRRKLLRTLAMNY